MLITGILYEWKEKIKGNITFDGIGTNQNDYYLSLDDTNNYSTHIHLITNVSYCYLCYLAKKNNDHSKLYIIDINKKPSEIVDEMISNFNKL